MGMIDRFGRIADTYISEKEQLLEAEEERKRVFVGHPLWPTEVLRDSIIELVERELPTDPKLAMAEVQRRRLEADQKDKYIRQLAPLGIRDRSEDKQASGSITLSWEGAEIVSG